MSKKHSYLALKNAKTTIYIEIYRTDILGGAFILQVVISATGDVDTNLFESDTDEEYVLYKTNSVDKNIVVYAKWLNDGTPKPVSETPQGATTAEILQYGNYIDEATGVTVTALWVQQNNTLNELMEIYNAKFNN